MIYEYMEVALTGIIIGVCFSFGYFLIQFLIENKFFIGKNKNRSCANEKPELLCRIAVIERKSEEWKSKIQCLGNIEIYDNTLLRNNNESKC